MALRCKHGSAYAKEGEAGASEWGKEVIEKAEETEETEETEEEEKEEKEKLTQPTFLPKSFATSLPPFPAQSIPPNPHMLHCSK